MSAGPFLADGSPVPPPEVSPELVAITVGTAALAVIAIPVAVGGRPLFSGWVVFAGERFPFVSAVRVEVEEDAVEKSGDRFAAGVVSGDASGERVWRDSAEPELALFTGVCATFVGFDVVAGFGFATAGDAGIKGCPVDGCFIAGGFIAGGAIAGGVAGNTGTGATAMLG